jgi:hypothetical protein
MADCPPTTNPGQSGDAFAQATNAKITGCKGNGPCPPEAPRTPAGGKIKPAAGK